jgi:galactose-1-phosphate uridylyltransferase
MDQQLTRQTLEKILQSKDISSLSFQQIEHYFLEEHAIAEYIPDGLCQVDPRNGDRIVYNTARAHRPHDNLPENAFKVHTRQKQDCVICQGRSTGVLDVTQLSEGFTFINKNLYPIFFPTGDADPYPTDHGKQSLKPAGLPAHGLHFLQWTSNFHDRDWCNMPQSDRVLVLERLGVLERKLLTDSVLKMPPTKVTGGMIDKRGYVSIIKNYGRLVGGSLAHGHQQITFSNVMPGKIRNNWLFNKQRGLSFATYLLQKNPIDLLIRDYGEALLLVPYFMRRPYDMFLVLKDTSKQYLHELNEDELSSVADGWHDATLAMLRVMPQLSREPAYNVTTINGPGAGLYFEFLPYTQEIGGMEHLGLYLCQGNPSQVADDIREILDSEAQSI